MKEHLPKINFGTFVGALLLLFLPWTVLQCSGEKVGTQSGLQVAYGGFTPSPRFLSMTDSENSSDSDSDDEVGVAILTVLSIVALLAGLTSAGLLLFKGKRNPHEAGLIALIAFICILLQVLVGTPIENAVKESYEESRQSEDGMDRAIYSMVNMEVKYTMWFYLYLLCLAVPAGFYVHDKVKTYRETNEMTSVQE